MNSEKLPREKFIRLGAALALAPTGATLLASCGGETSSSGGSEESSLPSSSEEETTPSEETTDPVEETTEAPVSGTENAIASASDVPIGEALDFEDAGQPAVLVHLEGGEFAAYSAVCTHQGCTVVFQPDSGQLSCPCHGSVFDPAGEAAVVTGPATSPLPKIEVSVRGGRVVRG